jgi:hypothetical protein
MKVYSFILVFIAPHGAHTNHRSKKSSDVVTQKSLLGTTPGGFVSAFSKTLSSIFSTYVVYPTKQKSFSVNKVPHCGINCKH